MIKHLCDRAMFIFTHIGLGRAHRRERQQAKRKAAEPLRHDL